MEGKLRKGRGFKTRRRVFTCDLSDVVWIQGSLPTLLLLLFVFPDGSPFFNRFLYDFQGKNI